MEPNDLNPDRLLRHLIQNTVENGAFDMHKFFGPMLDYIVANESWKRSIPYTFDFKSIFVIVFYAAFVIGFYFAMSIPKIAKIFLPRRLKSVKQSTIYWAMSIFPILIYCTYQRIIIILWRREKKRKQFLKRQALKFCQL